MGSGNLPGLMPSLHSFGGSHVPVLGRKGDSASQQIIAEKCYRAYLLLFLGECQ